MNGKKVKTGMNDRYCNIYDMLGNRREWTTEFQGEVGYDCVARGSDGDVRFFAAYHTYSMTSDSSLLSVGFRTQMYVK